MTTILAEAHPEAFDNCKPVRADGLRVTLPSETTPQFVPLASPACSTDGVNVLRVGWIGSGS